MKLTKEELTRRIEIAERVLGTSRYNGSCPSSNVSGQSRRCWNEGSGSFGLEFKRLSSDVAIVAA